MAVSNGHYFIFILGPKLGSVSEHPGCSCTYIPAAQYNSRVTASESVTSRFYEFHSLGTIYLHMSLMHAQLALALKLKCQKLNISKLAWLLICLAWWLPITNKGGKFNEGTNNLIRQLQRLGHHTLPWQSMGRALNLITHRLNYAVQSDCSQVRLLPMKWGHRVEPLRWNSRWILEPYQARDRFKNRAWGKRPQMAAICGMPHVCFVWALEMQKLAVGWAGFLKSQTVVHWTGSYPHITGVNGYQVVSIIEIIKWLVYVGPSFWSKRMLQFSAIVYQWQTFLPKFRHIHRFEHCC